MKIGLPDHEDRQRGAVEGDRWIDGDGKGLGDRRAGGILDRDAAVERADNPR